MSTSVPPDPSLADAADAAFGTPLAPPSAPRSPQPRGLARLGSRLRSAVRPARRGAVPLAVVAAPSLAPTVRSAEHPPPRHALDASVSLVPAGDEDSLFVGLLSPAGVVLDGFPRQAGPTGGWQDGSRLWEAPWWAWSPDVQDRLRSAVTRAGAGEVVRYGDTVLVPGNMLVTVDLTVTPVVTRSGITGVRCSVLDPGDTDLRRDPGRHASADGADPAPDPDLAVDQTWSPR